MRVLPPDARHEETVQPKPSELASALGNHGVDVVATTALILYFEIASNNLCLPYYERHEVSVGTHVAIDHLAPAMGDRPVRVISMLTLQQGRRIEFQCEAWQGDTLVMRGAHHRAVLDRRRFEDPAAEVPRPRTIEFWFDYHSPWCYFASHRITDIAREFNAELVWKPVHLANLNAAVDGRRPLESNPNFLAWYLQDMQDTATMMGLPLSQHADYPCRPSRALRASIYAAEQGLAAPFVTTVMRGYWSEQKDISDAGWLCEVAADVGLDPGALGQAMTSPAYKEKLGNNLADAVDAKLFGLPVARVDGKIFWGNDRLELLRHFLSGRSPALKAGVSSD